MTSPGWIPPTTDPATTPNPGPYPAQYPSPYQGQGTYPSLPIPAQRQGTPPAPKPPKRGTWKAVTAGAGGLVLGLVIGTSAHAAPTTTSTTAAASTATRAPATQAPVVAPPAASSPSPVVEAPPPPPPAPAGPLTTLSPGVYEVGTAEGQAKPGKYKSPGPNLDDAIPTGYYARLKHNDGSLEDIIANNISQGPSVVTVKPGDGYVEVQGCTFTQ
jgi:hypothetical protein